MKLQAPARLTAGGRAAPEICRDAFRRATAPPALLFPIKSKPRWCGLELKAQKGWPAPSANLGIVDVQQWFTSKATIIGIE